MCRIFLFVKNSITCYLVYECVGLYFNSMWNSSNNNNNIIWKKKPASTAPFEFFSLPPIRTSRSYHMHPFLSFYFKFISYNLDCSLYFCFMCGSLHGGFQHSWQFYHRFNVLYCKIVSLSSFIKAKKKLKKVYIWVRVCVCIHYGLNRHTELEATTTTKKQMCKNDNTTLYYSFQVCNTTIFYTMCTAYIMCVRVYASFYLYGKCLWYICV